MFECICVSFFFFLLIVYIYLSWKFVNTRRRVEYLRCLGSCGKLSGFFAEANENLCASEILTAGIYVASVVSELRLNMRKLTNFFSRSMDLDNKIKKILLS